MNDLVTIVTITYNAENLLEGTILSVINQNYENIEYIIIDGASTDKTIDIIKQYEDKINYWVSEPDDGIYFAMNKAIEKATGKWINFMNAGDTFNDKDTVAYVMGNKDKNAELIYGDHKIKESGIYREAYDRSDWYKNMPFCHQTLFTKTDIMKETPFDTCYRLAADYNFILKMHITQKNFYYLEKSLALFDTSGFAISNQLLTYMESLTVLLHNNVSKEDIEQSAWYFNLKKYMSIDQIERQSAWIKKQEQIIEEKTAHVLKQSSWIKKQEKVIEEKTAHVSKQSSWIGEQEQIIIEKSTKLEQLIQVLKKLSIISTLQHPIKKIKTYKRLMQNYHTIKQG